MKQVPSSRFFSGCCGRARLGLMYRRDTVRTKPAIAGSSSGNGTGVLDGILWALAEARTGLEESFIDASFMGAKKSVHFRSV